MKIYLFGYLSNDFLGRVIVTPSARTVEQLANQLVAWGPTADRSAPLTVLDEAGERLAPHLTISEAGLGNGDIFTVLEGM